MKYVETPPKYAIVLFSLLLLFHNSTTAQMPRRPGYVQLNSGEFIHGWISYKAWTDNPAEIVFRHDSSEPKGITYYVRDLKEFEVTGFDRYFRAYIPRDVRPMDGDLLPANKDSSLTELIWLRVLLDQPKAKLYEFRDAKPHYFIHGANDSIAELRFVISEDDGVRRVLPLYQSQLKGFALSLQDSTGQAGSIDMELSNKIDRVSYNGADLQRIIAEMVGVGVDRAEFTGDLYTRPRGTGGGPFVFIEAGGGSSQLTETPFNSVYAADLKFKKTGIPYIGAGLDFHLPRRLRDIIIQFELYYSRASYRGAGYTLTDDYHLWQYAFKQRSISGSLSLLYEFLHTRNVIAFAGAGIAVNSSAYKDVLYQQEALGLSFTDYFELQSTWASSHIKGGVRLWKHFEVGFLSQLSGGFCNSKGVGFRPRNFVASVGYYFNVPTRQ